MNSIQLPVAIRTTAAAMAVFVTIAALNSLVALAGPDQNELMAQTAARHAARMASAPRQTLLAEASMADADH